MSPSGFTVGIPTAAADTVTIVEAVPPPRPAGSVAVIVAVPRRPPVIGMVTEVAPAGMVTEAGTAAD